MNHVLSKITAAIFVFLAVGIMSCSRSTTEKDQVDLSQYNFPFLLERFEQDLYKLNKKHPNFQQLNQTYGSLPTVFFDQIVRPIDQPNWTTEEVGAAFLQSPQIQKLYDTIQVIYPELKKEEDQLYNAFRRAKHYFPTWPTPRVVTLLSEYSIGAFTIGNDILAIGLDFFLGKDYPHYDDSIFPDYIKAAMTRKHLVPTALKAWLENQVPTNKSHRLVDRMIRQGKIVYYLQKLLPDNAPWTMIPMTEAEWAWCEANESQIWSFFVDNELLHTEEPHQMRKYMDPAPYSAGMPEEAPGLTGVYIGYKIVSSYMQNNKGLRPNSIIQPMDADEFLLASKYKPRRN